LTDPVKALIAVLTAAELRRPVLLCSSKADERQKRCWTHCDFFSGQSADRPLGRFVCCRALDRLPGEGVGPHPTFSKLSSDAATGATTIERPRRVLPQGRRARFRECRGAGDAFPRQPVERRQQTNRPSGRSADCPLKKSQCVQHLFCRSSAFDEQTARDAATSAAVRTAIRRLHWIGQSGNVLAGNTTAQRFERIVNRRITRQRLQGVL